MIETAYRGRLARKELALRRERHARRQHFAALTIQSNYRGSRTRGKRLIARKRAARDNHAAHVIQSLFRGYAYREHRRRAKDEKERIAATKIQSLLRGREGRKRYQRIRAEHDAAEAQHNAEEAQRLMSQADLVAAVASSRLASSSAVYERAVEGVVHNKECPDYMTKRVLFSKYVSVPDLICRISRNLNFSYYVTTASTCLTLIYLPHHSTNQPQTANPVCFIAGCRGLVVSRRSKEATAPLRQCAGHGKLG